MSLDLNTIEWIKKLETENEALKKRVAYLEKMIYDETINDYEAYYGNMEEDIDHL